MICIKFLKDWCVLVGGKTYLYFCFVVFKDVKVINMYDFILFLYVYLIDGIVIIPYYYPRQGL